MRLSSSLSLANVGYITVASELSILSGGRLSGSGSITGNVTNAGMFDIGCNGTMGDIFITGNCTQTSTGTLHFELGSDNFASQLHVSGLATLAGTVWLALGSGSPSAPLGITLLHYGTRSGTFDTCILPLAGSDLWDPRYDDPEATFTLWLVSNPGA